MYSTLQYNSITNFQQKQPTPFLATNQVPGDFRPILYEDGLPAQNSYKGQTEQPIETQSVQYYEEDEEQQYLQKQQQQQQVKQHRPILAHQRLPEPQLHQYYRIEDQQHQRQKAEIQQLLHQEAEIQKQLLHQQNIHSQPIQVESSTTQNPRQEQNSPNYVTYLQPQNFVQFIKSTTPKPVANGKNVVYKIIRPTPKPPTHYVVYQHPEQEQEQHQPKQILRIPADADNNRNVVPDNNQIYQKANNEYKHQSQQEPTPVFRIDAENKPAYRLKEL